MAVDGWYSTAVAALVGGIAAQEAVKVRKCLQSLALLNDCLMKRDNFCGKSAEWALYLLDFHIGAPSPA